MKQKLLVVLVVCLLAAGHAMAQAPSGGHVPAGHVARYLKAHPEHVTAFTNQGAPEGMLYCNDASVMLQLEAYRKAGNSANRGTALPQGGERINSGATAPANAQELRKLEAVKMGRVAENAGLESAPSHPAVAPSTIAKTPAARTVAPPKTTKGK